MLSYDLLIDSLWLEWQLQTMGPEIASFDDRFTYHTIVDIRPYGLKGSSVGTAR